MDFGGVSSSPFDREAAWSARVDAERTPDGQPPDATGQRPPPPPPGAPKPGGPPPPKPDRSRSSAPGATKKLTPDEQKAVDDLKARDAHVRAHEAAHLAAAGGAATGPAHFEYQRGPDGQSYAIGGEVPIALTRSSKDPQITLQRAEQVYRAALAPSDPSGQDLAVAAQAMQVAVEARREVSGASGKDPAKGTREEREQPGSVDAPRGAGGPPPPPPERYGPRGTPVSTSRPVSPRDAAGNCTCFACHRDAA